MGVLYPTDHANTGGNKPRISLRSLFDTFFSSLPVDFDIAQEVQPYSFFEARPYLENNEIHVALRIQVAENIPVSEIYEVEDFLDNERIPVEIRRGIRVRSSKKLQEYIIKNTTYGGEEDKKWLIFGLIANMDPFVFSKNIDFVARSMHGGEMNIELSLLNKKIIFDFSFEDFFRRIGLDKLPESTQERNIQAVNAEQYTLASDDMKVILDKMDPTKRSLVFYYRGITQGVHFTHFMYMLECLKKYIEGGYSSLFNNFIITSRDIGYFPTRYESDYVHYSGDRFLNLCSLYSNTINITHGSVEAHSGSIPIIGEAIIKDAEKMNAWGKKEHIVLPLLYRNGFSRRIFPNLSIEEMLTILLRTVRELENAHIQRSLGNPTS